MKEITDVRMRHIKEICKLGRYSLRRLRKMNIDLERTYNGRELTKEQLIYQIVFYRDAPYD